MDVDEENCIYLKSSTNVVDGDIALLFLVERVEALYIAGDLFTGQVDGDLVATLPVHALAHLLLQELDGRRMLTLLLVFGPAQFLTHNLHNPW